MINKLIVLPLAFLLSIFAPWSISLILVFGGLYLLYEGAEKIEEYFHKKNHFKEKKELLESTKDSVLEIEKKKIKSAIFTDLILSIEIVILALNSVLNQEMPVQMLTTTIVAFLATFSVYGLVALIVRIDNIGFWCIDKGNIEIGNLLVSSMPKIINILSAVGTVAMLLVGGGILVHNILLLHYIIFDSISIIIQELIIGLIIGFVLLFVISILKKIFTKSKIERIE